MLVLTNLSAGIIRSSCKTLLLINSTTCNPTPLVMITVVGLYVLYRKVMLVLTNLSATS